MEAGGFVFLLLIGANVYISYKGFNSISFFSKYKFQVDKVLIEKDYKRIITSGFLHVSWNHLIMNMIGLYYFSNPIETHLGVMSLLLIYFASLIGGGLFSLYLHRNHGGYSAVGASGAVSGLIFASIALFPGLGIGILFIPFSIPSWLFGLLFVGYTIYGIKSDRDNIGHGAHLGGALIGMIIAILMVPSVISVNILPIALVLIPCLIFIYLIITKPHLLLINTPFSGKKHKYIDPDIQWNIEKKKQQDAIDKILEKVNRKGIDSLTDREREMLEKFSNKK